MLKGSNYEVLEVISEYGSKVIYRCVDPLSGEKTIVKVLRADYATYEEIMRFKREYKILLDLSRRTDGVVKPVKLEELGGFFVIALEDIGGKSLKTILAEEPHDQDTLLKLAVRIAEILGGIHDNQVIHKDLKPSNIIWNAELDEVRIIDFDLSVKLVQEKQAIHNTGLIEGTLPYISPEQTGRINRSIDYRSDFYSLGVIFYEMFTGQKPYEPGTVMDQIYATIAKKPASPYEITQGRVPQPLSLIIMKLLEKSPADRYRSAYGLKADLLKCLRRQVPFRIGEEDRLNQFQIPQVLYGRERELRELQAVFRTSVKGSPQLVLVSGEAGVGKTAFVNELSGFISQERGYFVQGKFDQYAQNMPYQTIAQAFGTLLEQLLNAGEAFLVGLRDALSVRLGDNGGLIANLIPELERLLGPQPTVEPLNPTEDTNRFFMSFVQFIEGMTEGDRPLVLFLDDLQWADVPSIQLLERLFGAQGPRKLLVIGSYRHLEVADGHLLAAAIEEIGKYKGLKRIHLQPLSEQETERLIHDALGPSGAEAARELSALVYPKTKGNPFFLSELLKDLYKRRAVYFDDRHGFWRLDHAQLQNMKLSDNVIDYLIGKLSALPMETQRILSLGASIGPLFDWKMVCLISDESDAIVAQSLLMAVHEDIIFPLNTNYSAVASLLDGQLDNANSPDIQFTFQHDKIQQALYQMIDPDTRNRLHLQIGRLLLAQLPPHEAEERMVDIAGNLNKGLALVTDRAELDAMVTVNIQAAKRAKDAFGYSTAFDFLQTAKGLLPSDAWTSQYSRTLELYWLYCECAYLTKRLQEADQAGAVLIAHTKTSMELAAFYEMQMNHYMYLGMMKESIDAGKLGLTSLGLDVPKRITMASVGWELLRAKRKLRGRSTEDLLDGPPIADERIKLMMRLLVSFIPPAFISGEQNLFAWAVLNKVCLSAQYGNSPESAGAYIGYAILLSGLGDLKGASDFGKLAVRINEKFDDLQWRSLVYVLYTLFCHGWSYSWDTLEGWYKKAIDASLKSGDLLYLAHAYYYMNLWNPSMEIERYLQKSARMLSMIENTGYKEAFATAKLARQKFLSLAGESGSPLSFDDASFKEADYLRELTEAKYFSGIAIYYLNKIQILYMYEQYEQALGYIDEAYKVIKTLAGSAFMEEFSLYTFLTLAACYPRLKGKDKLKARIRMRREYDRTAKWAAHNPGTFQPQHYMMKAELARIQGAAAKAETCYSLAIEAGGRGSFIRYKALASELAGKFYRTRGLKDIASYFLRQAAYYYSVWGARGKVNQLERDYPELTGRVSRTMTPPDHTISAATANIDIHSILMASQAISKEIGLDQLLHTLMEVVIVNAGAQRGCIVMKSHSSLLVEGEHDPANDMITVKKHDSTTYGQIPKSIIEMVAENQDTLICQDASTEISFAHDPYVVKSKPKSILCMPLLNQNKVTAIIYLENNLVTGAFTKERIKMIDLLSREMVYSLENASLYTDLERSEGKYRELVNHMMDGIIIIQDERLTFVNEAMAAMLGESVTDLADAPIHRFISLDDLRKGKSFHERLLRGDGESYEYEVRIGRVNGPREIIAIVKSTAIQYANRPAILGTVKDITERKRAEEELLTHRDKLEQLVAERTEALALNNSELNRYINIVDKNVMVIQTDRHEIITSVSEEFCVSTGYRKEEWVGRRHELLQASGHPEAPFHRFSIGPASAAGWRGELMQRTKSGHALWLDVAVEPVSDHGQIAGYTFIGHNITDKKRIEQLSITDELTGLYNRRFFKETFGREVQRAAKTGETLSFLLLDIDHYKKYNDTYGHYQGDHVLSQIGAALQAQLQRASDVAFRMGGEEFGIVYAGLDPADSYVFAERVRAGIEALQIPHEKNEMRRVVTVSIGLAVVSFRTHRLGDDAIYKLADDALYESKDRGRNSVTMRVL